MKAIIFSDSHKNFNAMIKAIEDEGEINYIIHAGDVQRDVEDLLVMYPKIPIAYVKGNNDPFVHDAPDDRVFELDGVKIFLTHGHNYRVKYSLAGIFKKGMELGANLVIFGHTHVSHNEKTDGITLFNPGSAAHGYGILETFNGKFKIAVKNFD